MAWIYWGAALLFGIGVLGYVAEGEEHTSPGQAKIVVICAVAMFIGIVLLGVLMGGGHNATHPWD